MKTILLILTMFISQMVVSQKYAEMLEISFVGKYRTGRAPCEWLPDGSRRWAITTGFEVIKIIEGKLEVTYVEIDYFTDKDKKIELKSEQEYLVTFKLTETRVAELGLNQANTIMTYHNPIRNEEILKIEKK